MNPAGNPYPSTELRPAPASYQRNAVAWGPLLFSFLLFFPPCAWRQGPWLYFPWTMQRRSLFFSFLFLLLTLFFSFLPPFQLSVSWLLFPRSVCLGFSFSFFIFLFFFLFFICGLSRLFSFLLIALLFSSWPLVGNEALLRGSV